MSHIALYRSWRPQVFRDLVGQEHVTTTLKNSLREGRFSHAYLFNGPRGTGKTSAAKILAKAVNCEHGPAAEPCNECPACLRITEGSVMDVVELDAASNNGVDEIREIRDNVKYAPTEVRRKVYIIDEVHMLSIGASNALLKTLEEPPAHVMFILATTEPHKLPVTIISRCQRYDFRRIALEDQLTRLRYICEQEQLDVDEEALQHIARLSDGGMRDALSLLDQIISFAGNRITYEDVVGVTGGLPAERFREMSEAMLDRDAAKALQIVDALLSEGKNVERCLENLMQYFRDMLMLKMMPETADEHLKFSDSSRYRELAERFDQAALFEIMEILNHYQGEMKYAAQPQLLFEIAVMKICSLGEGTSGRLLEHAGRPEAQGAAAGAVQHDQSVLLQLQQKLEQLERTVKQLQGGAPAGKSASAPTSATVDSPAPAAEKAAAAKPRSVLGLKGKGQLEAFLKERESREFKEMLMKWNQVLQRVKELKITVHAWLVDGEPVSASGEGLLVAFKNTIHRETTDKKANKQLIEQVLQEVYGKPVNLETMMLKEWNEALAEPANQDEEELVLTPDEPQRKEEWIDEAVRLFGEDLVEIKEE